MIFKANILGAFIGAVLLLSVQAKLSHPIVSVQNLGADKQQRLRLQDVVASSSSSSSSDSSSDTHHKLTSTNLIVDLIADLAPHGMLPLSYGLAKGGLTGIGKFGGVIEGGYFSMLPVLVVSCFMWSGALDSSGLL